MSDKEIIIDEPGISVCSLGVSLQQMALLSDALEKGEEVCIKYHLPFTTKLLPTGDEYVR